MTLTENINTVRATVLAGICLEMQQLSEKIGAVDSSVRSQDLALPQRKWA